MMSGTPILVYAPAGVATADYAAREGWGYVVSSSGESQLVAALRALMTDESLRRQLGCRAKVVAQTRHDAATVRTAFWETLRGAAKAMPVTSSSR